MGRSDPILFLSGDANLHGYVTGEPVNRSDSLGLYGSDTHYWRTKKRALELGICPETAARIASADNGFDSGLTWPWLLPWLHFQETGYRLGFMSGHHRNDLLTDAVAEAVIGTPESLGAVLHQYQDTYAHEGYYPYPGHVPWGSKTDEFTGSERDLIMMGYTTYILQVWKNHHQKCR